MGMSFKLDFPCINNMAEYEAYLTGLVVAREMGIKRLRVIGDSNLVVCQAKGDFALKEPSLAPYRTMAQRLEDSFEEFNIEHSLRSDKCSRKSSLINRLDRKIGSLPLKKHYYHRVKRIF